MADGSVPSNGLHQAHIDIEVISGKVSTLEGAMGDLRSQFSTLQRDVATGFTNQATSFGSQLRDLGEKIERQGRDFSTSRQTSISSFLITTATVGGFLGTIGAALFYPQLKEMDSIANLLQKTAEVSVRKDDFRDYVTDAGSQTKTLWSRLKLDEDNAVSQRQIGELKDRFDERYKITADDQKTTFLRLEKRIDDIDAQLVKRPEIEAANRSQDNRIDNLASRANGQQAQIDNMFPASKVIDELFNGLREMRTWNSQHGLGEATK